MAVRSLRVLRGCGRCGHKVQNICILSYLWENGSSVVNVSLIIMTFNEVEGARHLLHKIPFHLFHQIIAIDGGSTDGTIEEIGKFGIPVYIQKEKGLGAAVLEARDYVTGDAMLFFHPDGNELPEYMADYLRHLDEGHEFIIGSRMHRDGYNEEDERILKPRKWANLLFALMANLLFGVKKGYVWDVVHGYRALTTGAFDRMGLSSKNCTIDFQMIIKAKKRGIRIHEFPIREGWRIGGRTKFASLPTGIAELKMFVKEMLTQR